MFLLSNGFRIEAVQAEVVAAMLCLADHTLDGAAMPAGCVTTPSPNPQTLADELLVLFGDRRVGEELCLFPAPLFEFGETPGFGCLLGRALLGSFDAIAGGTPRRKNTSEPRLAEIPPDYRSGCPAP